MLKYAWLGKIIKGVKYKDRSDVPLLSYQVTASQPGIVFRVYCQKLNFFVDGVESTRSNNSSLRVHLRNSLLGLSAWQCFFLRVEKR